MNAEAIFNAVAEACRGEPRVAALNGREPGAIPALAAPAKPVS